MKKYKMAIGMHKLQIEYEEARKILDTYYQVLASHIQIRCEI
ncbi:MAG: hypothetical protein ACE5H1_01675 [Thermodesulfobacteriota bacterium]